MKSSGERHVPAISEFAEPATSSYPWLQVRAGALRPRVSPHGRWQAVKAPSVLNLVAEALLRPSTTSVWDDVGTRLGESERERLYRLEKQVDALVTEIGNLRRLLNEREGGGDDDCVVQQDPVAAWIEGHLEEVESMRGEFVVLHLKRGLMAHSADEGALVQAIRDLHLEDDPDVAIFHTDQYLPFAPPARPER